MPDWELFHQVLVNKAAYTPWEQRKPAVFFRGNQGATGALQPVSLSAMLR